MTALLEMPRREGTKTTAPIYVPAAVFRELEKFLLDKSTGNVEINIRHGEVMGATVTKHIKA